MNASFEEKSVWIQLISMVLALGAYFVIAGLMLANGIDNLVAYVPLFVGAVIVQVVILVGGHIVAAILRRPEPRDERDRIVGWRAEHNSSWILGVGVLAGITCMVISVDDVWVAHLLLGALFLSEVVNFSLQLFYYRVGM